MKTRKARFALLAAIVALAVVGFLAWKALQPEALPAGFASSNGRIEAVEIDVAAKTAGRVREILVGEGDYVEPGQELVRMDTDTLSAQLREAEAGLKQARIGVDTAQDQVTQAEAEKRAAEAVVAQRRAELNIARQTFDRSKALVERGATPVQQLDQNTATLEGAKAALSAAEAQAASAEAAINSARSGVVAAEASVEASEATVQRIKADIADSTLTSPRSGRVQYRVAQPGEIVAAGGAVLNLVDLTDVYMTFFLPTEEAGRVQIGSEVHLVLDAAPDYVIPASVSYVADVAQFTPKTVETEEERQKLTFRVKARIDPALLNEYIQYVKTGLPGVAHVRLDPAAEWPDELKVRLPGA